MNRRTLLKSLSIAACVPIALKSEVNEYPGVMHWPKRTIRVIEPMLGILACGIYGNEDGTCAVRYTGKFKQKQIIQFLKRVVQTLEEDEWPNDDAAGIGNIKPAKGDG